MVDGIVDILETIELTLRSAVESEPDHDAGMRPEGLDIRIVIRTFQAVVRQVQQTQADDRAGAWPEPPRHASSSLQQIVESRAAVWHFHAAIRASRSALDEEVGGPTVREAFPYQHREAAERRARRLLASDTPTKPLDDRSPALTNGQREANCAAPELVPRPPVEIPRFNEIQARQFKRATPVSKQASIGTSTSRRGGRSLGTGLPREAEQW